MKLWSMATVLGRRRQLALTIVPLLFGSPGMEYKDQDGLHRLMTWCGCNTASYYLVATPTIQDSISIKDRDGEIHDSEVPLFFPSGRALDSRMCKFLIKAFQDRLILAYPGIDLKDVKEVIPHDRH